MEVAHDPCSPTQFTAYRHPGSDSESCCSAKARACSETTRSQKSGQRAGEGPCWWELVSWDGSGLFFERAKLPHVSFCSKPARRKQKRRQGNARPRSNQRCTTEEQKARL